VSLVSLPTVGLAWRHGLLAALAVEGLPPTRRWQVVNTAGKPPSPSAEALRYFVPEHERGPPGREVQRARAKAAVNAQSVTRRAAEAPQTGAVHPWMRVRVVLRHAWKARILAHMASFPTLPSAWLPWTTNGLTAVALVAATWWSAAQRPEGVDMPSGTLIARSAVAGSADKSKKQASAPITAHRLRTAPVHLAPGQVGAVDESGAAAQRSTETLLPVSYQAPVSAGR